MIYNNKNEFERNKFLSKAIYLAEKECVVDLTKKNDVRTIPQNSYVHVCIDLFAIAYGITSFGAKVHLKEHCGFMVVIKDGKKDYRSTASLDVPEMTKFIEWIRNYSAIEIGYYIPTPDEYKLNRWAIDSEIEKFKEYL